MNEQQERWEKVKTLAFAGKYDEAIKLARLIHPADVSLKAELLVIELENTRFNKSLRSISVGEVSAHANG